jgi:CBS domain containing-hemolysin-like protein
MKGPQKILITILIGNLFVNLFISAIATRMMLSFWKEYGHFIAIVIVTPVLIILGEITPKLIAINSYHSFSRKSVSFLKFFHAVFYPVREVLLGMANGIIRVFNLRVADDRAITEEELDMAVRIGEREGVINKEERTFISNVMRFSRKEALNVMIPRNKAVFIPWNSSVKQAEKVFLETGVKRAPVYRGDLDHIVGVLDSRYLIPYTMGFKQAKNINRLLLPMQHYPSSKELGELLADFLSRKIQIAVVMDEYGGTAGIVTLSSILSELLGKEFMFRKDSPGREIKRLDDGTFLVPGTMQIDDFNAEFGEDLESKETETIGGYIIEKLEHFPGRSEFLMTSRHMLKVKSIRKNIIRTIELRKREGE